MKHRHATHTTDDAKAIRYSGRWKLAITYRNRWSDYEVIFSPANTSGMRPAAAKADRFAEFVGAPASSSLAVDSAEAFDDAARAAISFALAENKVHDHEIAFSDDGPAISRRRG